MMRPVSVAVDRRMAAPPTVTYARDATTGVVTLGWSDPTPVNFVDLASWGAGSGGAAREGRGAARRAQDGRVGHGRRVCGGRRGRSVGRRGAGGATPVGSAGIGASVRHVVSDLYLVPLAGHPPFTWDGTAAVIPSTR